MALRGLVRPVPPPVRPLGNSFIMIIPDKTNSTIMIVNLAVSMTNNEMINNSNTIVKLDVTIYMEYMTVRDDISMIDQFVAGPFFAYYGDTFIEKDKEMLKEKCPHELIGATIFIDTLEKKQVMTYRTTTLVVKRGLCKTIKQKPHDICVDEESKPMMHGLPQYYVKFDEKVKNRKPNDVIDFLVINYIAIFVRSVQRAVSLDILHTVSNFPSTANLVKKSLTQ
mmetsp:Transcript_20436/g.54157  ORF Transcript_20436/g.54157 Transcript_20436/m.54157 type:complete len:224 (-) Transcript_20436:728-1399(-)